jgi:hypothetical protein
VQGVVDAPVAGAGESVSDLVAGGRVDRCGAVVGGEMVLAREPVDGLHLGQDPAGDDRPDPVELGQRGAGAGDELVDLFADRPHLRVQSTDVVEMLFGQLQAHLCDGVVRAEFVQ